MESGDRFDLGNLVFTPIAEGLPFAPPASSPPPPPLLPNHTNGDLPRLAAAVELQGWDLPALTSTPTDVELVLNHLRPTVDRLTLSKGGSGKSPSRPTVVNAGLPVMNPWDLPGMPLMEEGRREKYYLTDLHDLCFTSPFTRKTHLKLKAPDGFWNQRDQGSTIWKKKPYSPNCIGHKKTLQFYSKGHPSGVGSKTNWIMNVYSLLDESYSVEDELVLCHVFEDDSPPTDRRPKCILYLAECRFPLDMDLYCVHESWRGMGKPRDNPRTYMGSSPMHHGPDRRSDPRLTSYIADLENHLLGDPDTSTDTDNWNPRRDIPPIADDGQSRKRKNNNRSDVWDYFTKIFARDRNGKELTFAACDHCFNLLSGDSSGGTNHLHRHKCSCPCKLQPVAAGRNAQGDVNVLSS